MEVLFLFFVVLCFVIVCCVIASNSSRGVTPTEESELVGLLKTKLPDNEEIVVSVNGGIEVLRMEQALRPIGFGWLPSFDEEKSQWLGDGVCVATDKQVIISQKDRDDINVRSIQYNAITVVETSGSAGDNRSITLDGNAKIKVGSIRNQDEAVDQFVAYVREKLLSANDANELPPLSSSATKVCTIYLGFKQPCQVFVEYRASMYLCR